MKEELNNDLAMAVLKHIKAKYGEKRVDDLTSNRPELFEPDWIMENAWAEVQEKVEEYLELFEKKVFGTGKTDLRTELNRAGLLHPKIEVQLRDIENG